MAATTRKQIKNLTELRLPDLWALYEEVTGEKTRAPNKPFLQRRIREAFESDEPSSKGGPKRPSRPKRTRTRPQSSEKSGAKKAPTHDTPISELSVTELQARHLEAIGRPTASSNVAYLRWRLMQAAKGRIPVGPRRRRNSNPGDYKVIPLRMETAVADQIDAARERLELPSRTALIRRALMVYLAKAGEADVAALLEQGE